MRDDIPNRVPAFCPLCQNLMQGHKSTSSYYDWGVCHICFIEFIDGREQKWKDGARPDPEVVKRYSERMRKSLAEIEEMG